MLRRLREDAAWLAAQQAKPGSAPPTISGFGGGDGGAARDTPAAQLAAVERLVTALEALCTRDAATTCTPHFSATNSPTTFSPDP